MSRRASHLRAVCAEASARGEHLVASWTERVAARDLLALFAAATGARFLLERPGRGVGLAAVGACAAIASEGEDRFARAAEQSDALFARLRAAAAESVSAAVLASAPKLVGGFAFADAPPGGVWGGWPALSFVLPELAVAISDGTALATASVEVAPGADAAELEARVAAILATASCSPRPPAPAGTRGALGFSACADRAPEAYEAGVSRALAAILRGELEKVVLARSCELSRHSGFAPEQVLARLRADHPDCSLFAVGHGDACFVGATPELLLERDGARLRASALAGSAPRGRTPEEDERSAQELRESKKEQEEHAIVRRALAETLQPLCTRLDAPEAPEILRLGSIQHLHTPFEGELRGGTESALLRLAARLHPTPATCGAPRAAAREFIAEHEQLERGWYAGSVGWLGSQGQGELVVALRCALLRGERATLLAGAGVVGRSVPRAELAETSLKLRATLPALVEL
ncbi:MAG: isochorismate synthase [Deltaproteobacteria bacterium]|nr:isochorismate synthase [Deltaproteobacteria bacterium]